MKPKTLLFESADAGCAGRCLELMKKFIQPAWLGLTLTSTSSGAYHVHGWCPIESSGSQLQQGPGATYDRELVQAEAFAAGFRAGMGSR